MVAWRGPFFAHEPFWWKRSMMSSDLLVPIRPGAVFDSGGRRFLCRSVGDNGAVCPYGRF